MTGFNMAGHEQPTVVPGPSGLVSVLGIVFKGDEAILDNGVLHSRSPLEAGIRFGDDPGAQGKGERVVSVWLTHPGRGPAPSYLGLCSVESWVDRAAGTGWKRVADHVNRMTDAVRGRVDLPHLNAAQKASLAALLRTSSAEAWSRSSEALRQALDAT